LLAQLKLSQPEYVHFKSKDGTEVAGYLYKPVDYVPGKYPTILHPTVSSLVVLRRILPSYPVVRGKRLRRAPSESARFLWLRRIFAKQSGRIGGTRTIRTTWQWSTTPSKRESRIPRSRGRRLVYGVFPLTSSLARRRASSGDFRCRRRRIHQPLRPRPISARLLHRIGYPGENKALWEKLAPFYKIKNITTPALFMGAT